ncbi:MAG: methyltransferase family protein [Promethearchaeota archaeon]|jgi:protein-S-isoprenylcysteine O-methyltransferase Ste14
MKGIEKLREKLPDYQEKSLNKFFILAFISFLGSLLFQLFMDSLPRIFEENIIVQFIAPFTPIFGSLIILCLGFMIVGSFWRVRDKYLTKYGELAYQKAFRKVVVSIPMIISVMIHSFFPTDFIVPFDNIQNLNWFLAYPILDLFFSSLIYSLIIRLLLFFIIIGFFVVFMNKTLAVFGIDYMSLLYIFYPEGSNLQNHEVYSILRHPTYHCLMLLGIGSMFLRTSIYSIIYFVIFLIGINIHIKSVEEKELIERFGDGYKKYKEEVPAFFVRLKDLKKYFSFIFTK